MASRNNNDLNALMCFDIYFFCLSKTERKGIKKIKPLKYQPAPLAGMDIIGMQTRRMAAPKKTNSDLLMLQKFGKKFNWKIDLQRILTHEHEALVLTDAGLTVKWVNKGFTLMTGYSRNHVTGKTPKLLQGKNTSEEVRARIRQKLSAHKPFTETITNYRKNNEEYVCRVTIFPVKDHTNAITHFLALESEAYDNRRTDKTIRNTDF